MRGIVSFVLCLMVISGCNTTLTPEQSCQGLVYGELNNVQKQISETETALANGYRVVRSTQPTLRAGTCMTNIPGSRPISYRCQKNSTMTVETPVSIDYAEERKKLAASKRRYDSLSKSADSNYAACLKTTS